MPPSPTRTLNPLPFQDLEPHRFEDLVRQLAYEFRDWTSLEAVGRSGSDDGIDIRGLESLRSEGQSDDDDGTTAATTTSRVWIFQCKREKAMPASRVRAAITESIPAGAPAPYGFVLAAACDVSKKARDAFREEMVARGVDEFAIWARGELEDQLFQPKNDRLLFAYFGLSLQPRRRSLATEIRSRVALKKQLKTLFDTEDRSEAKRYLLLRDPTDARYPRAKKEDEVPTRWGLYQFQHLREPNAICVLYREYLAWVTADGWDALMDYDVAASMARGQLRAEHAWLDDGDGREHRGIHHDFWNEYVPESERAWLKVMRYVRLERVIAIDPIGDGYYPVPQVFVDCAGAADPFEDATSARFERPGMLGGAFDVTPDRKTRKTLFPNPLPTRTHPPPKGFDHEAPDAPVSLSDQTSAALNAVLATLTNRRAVDVDANTAANEKPDRLASFRAWARAVALPVFDAFVRQLRAAGQNARIATNPERGTDIAIALRVGLDRGGYGDYRAPGHLRISAYAHTGRVMIDRSPQVEGASRYGAPPTPKLEDLTKEWLEREVLAMIERVRAGS